MASCMPLRGTAVSRRNGVIHVLALGNAFCPRTYDAASQNIQRRRTNHRGSICANVRCCLPADIADWHTDKIIEHVELPETRSANYSIPRRDKGAFTPFARRGEEMDVASQEGRAVVAVNCDIASVHPQCSSSRLDASRDIQPRAP